MNTSYRHIKAKDKAEAAALAAEIITADLELAIEKRDTASLMVSGGSSPKPLYERLSAHDLDWARVLVGLVDERWVPEGEAGSNASFIKESLLKDKAEAAHFLPMYSGHDSAKEGEAAISSLYLRAGQPFDIAVMGMGTDGHTASWFPGSPDLDATLDMSGQKLVLGVDAGDSPGTSGFPERATLSLPAVLAARTIILFIPGDAKADVFSKSHELLVEDAPVKALLDAGEKLIVITCPDG